MAFDPFTTLMLGSMAVDYIKEPIDRARARRDLKKDIKAAKLRLQKTDDTLTSNPYVNKIRERDNKDIEKQALEIEETKEL